MKLDEVKNIEPIEIKEVVKFDKDSEEAWLDVFGIRITDEKMANLAFHLLMRIASLEKELKELKGE